MVDYSFYTGVYYGNKVDDPTEFIRLSRKAANQVEKFTFGRSTKVDQMTRDDKEKLIEKIKFTICEVIDVYASVRDFGGIKSEKSGDYSITYESGGQSVDNDVYKVICDNLSSTGLMYMGIDRYGY